jgi:glucokinase
MTAILTIDCGGTKTRLTLWQATCSAPQLISRQAFPTDFTNEASLLQHLQAFICGRDDIEAVVLDFAGMTNTPDGILRLTNNSGKIDLAALRQGLPENTRFAVLNDLEALAYAISELPASALKPIDALSAAATPNKYAPKLAAALGTGFGMAALLPGGMVIPSEAGHCSFAPDSAAMREVCDKLCQDFPFISVEHLLCGQGLARIYQALSPNAPKLKPEEISELGHDGGNDNITQTFRLYSEALGSALGNFALTYLASGGIYIGGGVAAKNSTLIDGAAFRKGFCKPGPFADFLATIPVYIIEYEDAPSFGAAIYGDRRLLG